MAKKIIIVGAGIIGASIAYNLAAKGAAVTVLDANANVGGVATPNSWSWINASWGHPVDYVKLRMRAMAMWKPLADVHANLMVNWCGGLLWDLEESALLEYVSRQSGLGYDVRIVDRNEALQIEPNLLVPPKVAAFAANEGMIDPVAAVQGFVETAKQFGAIFVGGQKVSQLVVKSGRVVGVQANGEVHDADEVVLAGGLGCMALLKNVGVNLKVDGPAGLLVHTEPTSKMLNGLVMSPEFHVRQTAEGQLVLGSDFGGTRPGDDPAATAKEILAKLPSMVRGTENLKMEFYTLGYRPTPIDGFPVIGRPGGVDGLYVAITHSGITLAPAVGEFGAEEILKGVRHDLLRPYHPDRLM